MTTGDPRKSLTEEIIKNKWIEVFKYIYTHFSTLGDLESKEIKTKMNCVKRIRK